VCGDYLIGQGPTRATISSKNNTKITLKNRSLFFLSVLSMHRSPLSVFFPSIQRRKKSWHWQINDIARTHTGTATQLNTDSLIHYELIIILVERFLVLLSSYLSYALSFVFVNPLAAFYCLRLSQLLFVHYNNKIAAFEERVPSVCVVCGHTFYASLSLPPQNASFSPTLCA